MRTFESGLQVKLPSLLSTNTSVRSPSHESIMAERKRKELFMRRARGGVQIGHMRHLVAAACPSRCREVLYWPMVQNCRSSIVIVAQAQALVL